MIFALLFRVTVI